MKKIFFAVFTIVLLFLNITSYAEQDIEKCINNLFVDLTPELKENIENSMLNNYIDVEYNRFLNAPSSARTKIDLSTDNDTMYEQFKESYKLDYNYAIKVHKLSTQSYFQQYLLQGKVNYLVDDNEYIAVLDNKNHYGCYLFDEQGNNINSENIDNSMVLNIEGFEFLKDANSLSQKLNDIGVTYVSDAKLVIVDETITCLMISGDKDYCIRVYTYNNHEWTKYPNLVNFTIYSNQDVVNEINKYGESDIYDPLYKNSLLQKPDYTIEAESLVNDGLLYGNENGLDLLKPMTRAEAATILMRALGVDENIPQVATFSDVSSSFWGFKYIEEAAKLGIVQGMGDGTFAPNSQVTDNQFATMVLRAAKETDFDWETAINLFVERGYITGEQADRMDLFTRGDMAKLIYEAKQHGMISK